MKQFNAAYHEKITEAWKKTGSIFRKQLLAKIVFSQPVNMAFGMITAPKEGGGIYVSKIPICYLEPTMEEITERMKTLGWDTSVRNAAVERSMKKIVTMANNDIGVYVQTHPIFPEEEAIRFCAVLAVEAMNVKDNGEGQNADDYIPLVTQYQV